MIGHRILSYMGFCRLSFHNCDGSINDKVIVISKRITAERFYIYKLREFMSVSPGHLEVVWLACLGSSFFRIFRLL